MIMIKNDITDMKLLLHQCCGPCSISPVEKLLGAGIKPFGFFYNPNIHPYQEYQRRLDTLVEYNNKAGIEYHVEGDYGLKSFLAMAHITPSRCEGCYAMRFERVGQFAKENGYSHISTTLLYSKRQNHSAIMSTMEAVAKKYGVIFFYEDFRDGWQEGIKRSKEELMYRQQYCGCIFSEEERYRPKSAVVS